MRISPTSRANYRTLALALKWRRDYILITPPGGLIVYFWGINDCLDSAAGRVFSKSSGRIVQEDLAQPALNDSPKWMNLRVVANLQTRAARFA
jgi:hypothetical protein